MVDDYNETNVGGLSSSRDQLEKSVNKCIKEDVLQMGTIQKRKDDIPISSMSRICNRVMAIEKFNIMNNVSNKTESRSSAE